MLCVVRDVCVGLSLTQSSSIAWGVSEFDREASTIRRPCLTRHFCVMKKIINNPINTFFFFLFSLVPSSAYSCRCRGLLLRLITRKDKHTRQESSGRVNSPTQRPLPDIIQKSQQTDIYVPPRTGFEPAVSTRARPQTHALDRTATGIGEIKS